MDANWPFSKSVQELQKSNSWDTILSDVISATDELLRTGNREWLNSIINEKAPKYLEMSAKIMTTYKDPTHKEYVEKHKNVYNELRGVIEKTKDILNQSPEDQDIAEIIIAQYNVDKNLDLTTRGRGYVDAKTGRPYNKSLLALKGGPYDMIYKKYIDEYDGFFKGEVEYEIKPSFDKGDTSRANDIVIKRAQTDATLKRKMNPFIVNLVRTKYDELAKAYTKEYASQREKIGGKSRKRKTSRKVRKTRRTKKLNGRN